jgi:anti-anti-sigma regulatory factor
MSMNIYVEEIQTSVPVTLLKLVGILDANNYQELIDKTRQLYQVGTRQLLIDFGLLTFMSSSGLIALHDIALLMRGDPPTDIGEGWSAYHAISHFVADEDHYEKHVKLLNPQPRVRKTLETTGFDHILEIFDDRDAAIASFQTSPEVL